MKHQVDGVRDAFPSVDYGAPVTIGSGDNHRLRRQGVSHRGGALTVGVAVVMYALITEPRPSVIRATILVTLAMTAVFLRRPLAHGNWIALGAIMILVCRPADLFDVGFQLSFACTLAVMYLHPRLLSAAQVVLGRPSDDVLKLVVPPSHWWPSQLPRITGSVVAAFATFRALRNGFGFCNKAPYTLEGWVYA